MSQLEFTDSAPNTTFQTLFVDVILPLPLPKLYTYRIPHELNDFIAIGSRVVVQFGKKKVLTAIIAGIHDTPPHGYEAKYILELLDDEPIITQRQIKFFDWLANYYMCHLGEVLNASLPSGLKLSSESRIQLNPETEIEPDELEPLEKLVIDSLIIKDSLTYDEVSEITGKKSVYPLIKRLIKKEAVILFEKLKDKYKPKTIKKIRLNVDLVEEENLSQVLDSLNSKAKQQEVLLRYLQKIPVIEHPDLNDEGMDKSTFLKTGISKSSLATLTKNGILEEFEIIVSRFDGVEFDVQEKSPLTQLQHKAKYEILEAFDEHHVTLLHGVTGSGKTEIFIDLIADHLAKGEQVLYLLPEIALTTQIVVRLRKVFGETMGVYHSRYSDNERVETWKGILDGRFNFVVGVRSSVFLPFDNLGLIIVDEEHDSSYKQFDPAPRYNARDAAIVLGQLSDAKVLLGSATPSVESFYHASKGTWGLVSITERFGNAQLPAIIPVDVTKNQSQVKEKRSFSPYLIDEIGKSINNDKQAIIFQNRRGYAPYMQCQDCQTIVQCSNCAVSLTYHMYTNELRCHYCGYTQGPPSNCSACGSQQMFTQGFGTEKIEDELKIIFPQAEVDRMDFDTTRKKQSFEQIIQRFANRVTNILVGTQMIAKGLDFDHVDLVGVFDSDGMINFPDFRAEERAFQMIMQVGGRAGRRTDPGRVLVQTRNPRQPIFNYLVKHDYIGFINKEIWERQRFHYPPFTRIIRLIVKDLEREKSHAAATRLTQLLQVKLSKKRVLGPQEPMVNKIRNNFLNEVMVKLEREGISLKKAKAAITEEIHRVKTRAEFKTVQVVVDVDPV